MFDLDAAVARFVSASTEAPSVPGAPDAELTRSVAAARVARHAADEGLRLFHFEHRALLDVPSDWLRTATDGAQPTWEQGVLPEPKYGAFRHDQGIGSFHPGHRAKWSTHELCHGLVGTAWAPEASPLFHATAGRLAEMVPVVLWYFLDEVGLRRCPRHREPTFRTHCVACEALASAGAVDAADARRRLSQARDFMEAELDAVAETMRKGVPVHHVHGSLDLCSDGLAYAAAHGHRLSHPGFAAWAARYLTPATGGVDTLEALQQRAVDVFLALATDASLPARGGTPWGWVAQDLAARVLQGLHSDADACGPIWDALDAEDVEAAIHAYADASNRLAGAHPADVFAPGYDLLDGVGRAVEQLDDGLRTVVPMTLQLADDAELDLVEPFAFADVPARRSLGLRFADWLVDHASPHVAALARYEAQLRAASGEADLVTLGAGEGMRWAHGVQRWSGAYDPTAYAEDVDAGAIEGFDVDGVLAAPTPPSEPTSLVMGRTADGELVLVALPAGVDPLQPPTCDELLELGVLVPERWALSGVTTDP